MRRRAALAIWDGSVRNHTSNRGACGMVKQKGGIACIWGETRECDLGICLERWLRRAVRGNVMLVAVGGRKNRRNLRMLVRKGAMVR